MRQRLQAGMYKGLIEFPEQLQSAYMDGLVKLKEGSESDWDRFFSTGLRWRSLLAWREFSRSI